jgi:predicted MFS family arabinose efflux permease
VGARRGLLVAAATCAAGLAAGAVTTAPLAVYVAAAVAGAGGAFWRVAQAPTLIRLAPPTVRARIFSLNVAVIIGSGAAGMAVAGATPAWLEAGLGVTRLTALRLGLAIGAACTGLSFLVYAALRLPAASQELPASPAHAEQSAIPPAPSRQVLLAVFLVGVWMLGPALVAPFFNLYFFKTFSLSVERVGLIFAVGNGLWAVAVLASGESALRWGVRRVAAACLFLFGPVVLLFPFAGLAGSLVLFLVNGAAQPMVNPLIDQALMERSLPARRGMVSGWRNIAADLSAMAGASVGGWILATSSFTGLFISAGIVALMAALPLTLVLFRLFRPAPVAVSPD